MAPHCLRATVVLILLTCIFRDLVHNNLDGSVHVVDRTISIDLLLVSLANTLSAGYIPSKMDPCFEDTFQFSSSPERMFVNVSLWSRHYRQSGQTTPSVGLSDITELLLSISEVW